MHRILTHSIILGEVIKGWDTKLVGICPGETRKLVTTILICIHLYLIDSFHSHLHALASSHRQI